MLFYIQQIFMPVYALISFSRSI